MAAIEDILQVERIETDIYRGPAFPSHLQRTFGGQVAGQALMSATRTVDDEFGVHSLHGYFLRPGNPDLPAVFLVDRIRDGRSFVTRRVTGIQNGEAIFTMSASFHAEEEGFSHQAAMPDVPMPEDIPAYERVQADDQAGLPHPIRTYFERERPIEVRPVEYRHTGRLSARFGDLIWIRTTARLPDDPAIHQAVLAYASDITLLDVSLIPHDTTVFDPGVSPASLDHAMWFHRPFRADDWLLYAQDSPSAGGGRGFSRGQVFRRDGTLIASVSQEGLIRRVRRPSHGE